MKKMLLAIFAFTLASSLCFAEETSVTSSADNSVNSTQASSNAVVPTQPVGNTAPSASAENIIFTGKAAFVSSGDDVSATHPQITATDNHGIRTSFMVPRGTTIIGKDGNAINLTWIGKDDAVVIEYTTTSDGTKTAKSIKVSQGW